MDVIRIGEKHYDTSKLPESVTALLNDIAKVDGEMNRLSLQIPKVREKKARRIFG